MLQSHLVIRDFLSSLRVAGLVLFLILLVRWNRLVADLDRGMTDIGGFDGGSCRFGQGFLVRVEARCSS